MTIKLTRKEAIQDLKAIKSFERYARGRLALDIAIDALKHEQPDEWCTDCKEYDTEKKCCPRFNKVIREALKREPSDDGTLEVKVEDATKVGRVLISDDKHRGGLYYPDEDEPQSVSFENDTEIKSCSKDSDLISRAEAIEALGEEPPVWCDDDAEIAERSQWRADIEAIKSVPSADRPRGEWIPVKWHEITEEEREREGYPKDWVVYIDCDMPCDGDEILVQTKSGYIRWDVCYEEGEFSLDSGWDWIEDIVAWMPLPEPYKEGRTDA